MRPSLISGLGATGHSNFLQRGRAKQKSWAKPKCGEVAWSRPRLPARTSHARTLRTLHACTLLARTVHARGTHAPCTHSRCMHACCTHEHITHARIHARTHAQTDCTHASTHALGLWAAIIYFQSQCLWSNLIRGGLPVESVEA